jgi:hypothetical protein
MKNQIERLIKDLQEKEKEERESADIYRKIYDGYKKEGIEDHDFKRYEERETAHADGILFARRKLENILEDLQRTEEEDLNSLQIIY